MKFNSFLFPKPQRTDYQQIKQSEQHIFIPKEVKLKQKIFKLCDNQSSLYETQYIPCKFIQQCEGYKYSNNILIYFHANAEDLFEKNRVALQLKKKLKTNILLVEYPGYGIYKGKTDSLQIEQDSIIVYDYLVRKKGIKPKNIIIMGRSIGTGPATYLASKREVGLLVLISPFSSIKQIAKDLFGGFLSKIVKQRFQNDQNIKQTSCPCFFIHGIYDELIPYTHSLTLLENFDKQKQFGYYFSQDMKHNEFNLQNDIVKPIKQFLKQINYQTQTNYQPSYDFTSESRIVNQIQQYDQNNYSVIYTEYEQDLLNSY